MKFLADMGISQKTVLFLRTEGHDTIHLREQAMQKAEDGTILQKARQEQRTIALIPSLNAQKSSKPPTSACFGVLEIADRYKLRISQQGSGSRVQGKTKTLDPEP